MNTYVNEICANKKAWGLIAEAHYENYKKRLAEEYNILNGTIIQELGDIQGKKILHLQCNTGADSISLARMGGIVTGVDLVPENIIYAEKLANDFKIKNIKFIESDIMDFIGKDENKYDIVFTTEGVIKWLPNLEIWAKTIRYYIEKHGFFYMMDHHPFYLLFDQEKLKENELLIKYFYFKRNPNKFDTVGGYASPPKKSENFYWIHKISDVINSLSNAGFHIKYLNEFDKLFFKIGDMVKLEKGFYQYPFFKEKLPFTFSLKATVAFNSKETFDNCGRI
jgi:SAM-dependent methyltransferase